MAWDYKITQRRRRANRKLPNITLSLQLQFA